MKPKHNETNQEPRNLDLMIEAGIKSGEWQYVSKASLQTVAGDPRTQLYLKVYFIGLMHTQGYTGARRQRKHPNGMYQVELAVKLVGRGRQVPMTPWDIGQELVDLTRAYYERHGRTVSDEEAENFRPDRQHLRRALEMVERLGYGARATMGIEPRRLSDLSLVERQKVSGSQRLSHYFFVKPTLATVSLPEVAKFGYLEDLKLTPAMSELYDEIRRLTGRDFRPEQLPLFRVSYRSIEDLHSDVKLRREEETAAKARRKEAEQRFKDHGTGNSESGTRPNVDPRRSSRTPARRGRPAARPGPPGRYPPSPPRRRPQRSPARPRRPSPWTWTA